MLEGELRRAGLRFRKQYPTLGRPDFAFPSLKVAVFCDSDFWHGRNWRRGARDAIKTNRDFWLPKIERNIRRDRAVNRKLKAHGWVVLRFWENEIEGDAVACAARVREEVLRRRAEDEASLSTPIP